MVAAAAATTTTAAGSGRRRQRHSGAGSSAAAAGVPRTSSCAYVRLGSGWPPLKVGEATQSFMALAGAPNSCELQVKVEVQGCDETTLKF